jgi:uncharacterized protein
VHLLEVANPAGAVVLGHGAGGGIQAPDLQAAAAGANEAGFTAALVEQPYRVAGRRSQPAARQLDSAWLAVIGQLGDARLRGMRLIAGGRSAGARVACRAASETNAVGVLCLAFPVHPPGRADDPTKSRLSELEAVQVPVLVVQGENDPFGIPPKGPRRTVVRVPGDHSLRNAAPVRAAVAEWLAGFGERPDSSH